MSGRRPGAHSRSVGAEWALWAEVADSCPWWQQSQPAATPPVTHWDGGRADGQSPGHVGTLAWPASPSWVGLLTWLLVLGTPARQQFWESCCLREKCVPGTLPCRPTCPGGQRKLQAGLRLELQGSVAPRGGPCSPCCVPGFLSTRLLSRD